MSGIQDRPICFKCTETIETDMVFEALCGHDRCASAVWHPLCLMEFREERERAVEGRFAVVGLMLRPLIQEHTEHG